MVTGTCAECHLPPPADWCWAGRLSDCPCDKPPRYLDVHRLWVELKALRKRVETLEKKRSR